MHATGVSPDGKLPEILEVVDHPWFVAVQFHPEFKSKPIKAQPLFAGFIGAAIARRQKKTTDEGMTAENAPVGDGDAVIDAR